MLKGIGLILAAAACALWGFSESRELSRHLESPQSLLQMTMLLKGEIRWGNAALPEAFRETAQKLPGPLALFLRALAEKMEKGERGALRELFQECAEQNLQGLRLSREEWADFYGLGGRLGGLDREAQHRALEFYEKELEYHIEVFRREMPQRKKTCEKTGVVCGILLAVLLF